MEHNVMPAWNRADVSEKDQQKAIATIDALLTTATKELEAAIKKAQAIADEFDVNIYLAPTGYGSGSTYHPNLPKDWDSSTCSGYGDQSGTWVSSSQNC